MEQTVQGYRLSAQQRRVWSLGETSPAWRTQGVVLLEGDLDAAALRSALRRVVERHEALRTSFRPAPGMRFPLQVAVEGAFDWREVDLSAAGGEGPGAVEDLLREEGERSFDLAEGRVLRACLAALAPRRSVLVLSLPALAADPESIQSVVAELSAFYGGGTPPVDAPVQYADFAAWQSELSGGDDPQADEGRAYWERWRGAAVELSLPFELRDAGGPSPAGDPGRAGLTLAPELRAGVEVAARRFGAGVADVVLACWYTLLWRLTGQTSVVVGVAFDGRTFDELAGACGPFRRFLPVEGQLEPAASFESLARRVHEFVTEAREMQHYFGIEAPGAARDAAFATPAVGFESAVWREASTAAGVRFSMAGQHSRSERLKLSLLCLESPAGLRLELAYDRSRFAPEDMDRLVEELETVLASAAGEPAAPLAALDIVGPRERSLVLGSFQGAPAAGGDGRCIHQLFEEQAERRPEARALVSEVSGTADGVKLTYADLNAQANRLAWHLIGLGVGPEVPVALLLERSAAPVIGMLAALKAGGAYVAFEPSEPVRRLRAMLEEVRPGAILTQQSLAGRLPETAAAVVCVDAEEAAIGRGSDRNPPRRSLPGNVAYVVFTSGSTGRPKGVAVEHRQLRNYLDGMVGRLEIEPGMSFATVSTFAADLGNTAIFPTLCGGGCLHVVSRERASDAAELAAYLQRHPVDGLKLVPSHMEALLAGVPQPQQVLPRRRLVLGGERFGWKLFEDLHRLAPGCAVFNHYGPSETTVGVLARRVDGAPRDGRADAVPLGRPIAGTQVFLLDQRLEPVPVWAPGEVFIGGASVSRGYLGRPDLTAERFSPDPWSGQSGARLYRTGDLARFLPDGEVEFLGRIDHQVKYHGFRVELEEIRTALNRHPQVRDSVVLLRRDDGGRDVLVAYYVSRQAIDVSQLREFLASGIPEEVLPGFFVHLRRLPLTLNGKVNYDALPSLDEVRQMTRQAFVAARTPTEELMAGIWARVLGLERVSIHDSFFELGGHSLLATQLISRVRQVFGAELPLRVLFEEPTVAGLAQRVERAQRTDGEPETLPLQPVPRDCELPLSFAQERMWYLHQLDPSSTAYNGGRAYRVSGRLDVAALARSLREIVQRHEILRTSFVSMEGRPVPVIAPEMPVDVPVTDLAPFAEAEREQRIRELIEEEIRRPHDLARGPLIRMRLLRLGEAEHVLVVGMHHIVADGWSRGVLMREVMALYGALSTGLPTALPRLPIQYADFACWQRRWIEGRVLETEISHWKRRLSGAPQVFELPTDFPRPAVQSFRGAHRVFELPPAVCRSLREICRNEGTTLFMVLLAVFEVLLHRYTGQSDIVVGTDVANRNRLEIEPLIGFFVNNLVLRVDASGNPGFCELLRRVRAVTLDAYAHQDLPFERLVTALRPQRDPSRMPLFQILFVMQNTPAPRPELPGLTFEEIGAETGSAKFDLALFFEEKGDGLRGVFNYSTDLFKPETIDRIGAHFTRLVEGVIANPEARIEELPMYSEEEERERALKREQSEEATIDRLRARRRSAARAAESLVRTEPLDGREASPLVIQPNARDLDLPGWVACHRDLLERELLQRGAILFRGFGIGSVAEFERLATSVSPDLFAEYGDLPSDQGGGKVYHSTPYPADKAILFHNESSHLPRWPLKQWFFCMQAAREGGETPIVDCRAIYRQLDPALRERFEEKGLMYVRSFTPGLDVSWQQFFRTEDRSEVEERCRRDGMEAEWKGDRLQTRQVSPAVATHPKTGEKVFFNQLQLHHAASLEPEVRASMLSLFGESDLPRNVFYGDGTPIEDAVVAGITEVYWKTAVIFPWQEGDVLMVDNMLTAHARNPFSGPRKIMVAMAEMIGAEEIERQRPQERSRI